MLIALARQPTLRVGELAIAVDTTERNLYRVLADLQYAGLVRRSKNGTVTRYELVGDAAFSEPPVGTLSLSDWLEMAARIPTDDLTAVLERRVQTRGLS